MCYCTRCLRQEQLTKLRTLFISLGGPSADLENFNNLLIAYNAQKKESPRKLSKIELKRLSKKLAELKKCKESLEKAKGVLGLARDQEKTKRDMLLETFNSDNGASSSSASSTVSEDFSARSSKRKFQCRP